MSGVEDLESAVLFHKLNESASQNDRDPLGKLWRSIRKSDMIAEDKGQFSLQADILSTPQEYIFYIDVPGLSKSDIQVELEDDSILVVKSSVKRKREDEELEDCKYLKLERRLPRRSKMMRKFRLPQDADVSAIAARCDNGVLTVTVQKAQPVKPKTVQVVIS